MLTLVFTQVLSMSLTGGLAISVILAARLALKKAPRIFSYALWSVVLFRLICPFSFESLFSLMPVTAQEISGEGSGIRLPQMQTGIAGIDHAVNAAIPASGSGSLSVWMSAGAVLWLTGIVVLLLYSLFSLRQLRKNLKSAILDRDNLYLSESIQTPFVIGMFRPKIYLPATLSGEQKRYIVLHEQTHIRRLDHLIKITSFLTLCIHWFNPLVWLAFFLSGKDMEMSCDEAVIRKLGPDIKQDYSSSLLVLATGRQTISGAPLAFGEGDTKSRVKNVLSYKKPAFWIILTAVAAVAALCVGLAANPLKTRTTKITFPAYQDGRADYNAYIYDTEPFTLSLKLPEGWTVRLPPEEERTPVVAPGLTPVSIFNGEALAATVYYNVFTLYEGDVPRENFWQTVYPELRLSSMFQWDQYTPVKTIETAETATAAVTYLDPNEIENHPGAMPDVPQIEVPGILSYDKDMLVYVAIQFAEDAVITEQQLNEIAQSVALSR